MGGFLVVIFGFVWGKDGVDWVVFFVYFWENLRRAFVGEEFIENSRVEEIYFDIVVFGCVFGFCYEILI